MSIVLGNNRIDVSIITVGMNHAGYIRKLYGSLHDYPVLDRHLELIYVDNCSSDDSIEFLTHQYSHILVSQNRKKEGFGSNNNKGFGLSSGHIVGIVNPDIVFTEKALDRIVDYLETTEKEVILAPQLLNPDGTLQYSPRRFMSMGMMICRFLSRGDDQSKGKKVQKYLYKDMDFNKIQPIDWAIGAALFMKRETYLKLGGFDERYFLYMEDEDLCLRAWKSGVSVIYFPKAQLIHNHLRGSRHIGKMTFYHLKSMIIFFRLHGFRPGRKVLNK